MNTHPPSGCAGYQRLNRRGFLTVGSLSALGLSFSDFLRLRDANAASAPRAGAPRAKSVIVIYAMGGISHHDSFDPKPDAASDVRGEFRSIPSKIPGIYFTDQIPLLANQNDKFALIRSVRHGERDHGVAFYYMLRGYPEPNPLADQPARQANTHPNIGSHVARLLGARAGSANGLPPYIVVPGLSYTAEVNFLTAGWMGRAYDPYLLKADPNSPNFEVKDLFPPKDVTSERISHRLSIAKSVENRMRRFESSAEVQNLGAHYEKAYRVLTAGATRKAFDLASEPDDVRDRYGKTRLAQSCLLARRLVEAGVPFVTVDDDGWDHHGNVFKELKKRLPELDRCLSALLTDLDDRGLLKTTLVVLLTDFGRTPKVNASAGRDHWPDVFSVLFAGAGIRGGQVIGSSDRIGGEPSDRPITPKDLAATIYHLLGINPFQEYLLPDGRPMKMLDEGEIVKELA